MRTQRLNVVPRGKHFAFSGELWIEAEDASAACVILYNFLSQAFLVDEVNVEPKSPCPPHYFRNVAGTWICQFCRCRSKNPLSAVAP